MTNPFTIQTTGYEVLIWAKCYDGRKVCIHRCNEAFEARLWIENAINRLNP